MAKQPGIFIKNQTVRDAHHPTQGNSVVFKASVGALIDAGNIVAVGEESIERTFDNSESFKDWFDSMEPTRLVVEDPPEVPL